MDVVGWFWKHDGRGLQLPRCCSNTVSARCVSKNATDVDDEDDENIPNSEKEDTSAGSSSSSLSSARVMVCGLRDYAASGGAEKIAAQQDVGHW